MENKLIFDLGFFNGDDTAYYMSLGYNVVAVEANTELFEAGCDRFDPEIESGQLVLIEAAFADSVGSCEFYIHPTNPDWSTCSRDKTQYWDVEPIIQVVKTINLYYLIEKFYIPYYIKTDIEGYDNLVLKQLENLDSRPEYLSIELSRFDYFRAFNYLYHLGYKHFQLRNQANNRIYCSGEFGKHLPQEWLDYDECLTRYMKYKELKAIDNINLALGWLDVHARF